MAIEHIWYSGTVKEIGQVEKNGEKSIDIEHTFGEANSLIRLFIPKTLGIFQVGDYVSLTIRIIQKEEIVNGSN